MDMILGDTPMITGTWVNPRTGHSFTAKDTYMEDSRMYVLTTDGQRIDYEMLSQYVKSDNPQQDLREFSNPQPAAAVLPPEVQSAILPTEPEPAANHGDDLLSAEDKALISGMGAQNQPGIGYPANPGLGSIHQPEDEDSLLVRRMLKRAEKPSVNCYICWDNFPTKQMDMLDTMGVDYEKIAEFYMKDLDIKSIQEIIKGAIVTYIEKSLLGDQETKDSCAAPIAQKEVVIEKTQPKEINKVEDIDVESKEPIISDKTESKTTQKKEKTGVKKSNSRSSSPKMLTAKKNTKK